MSDYHMEKRRARKVHICKMGDGPIYAGEDYWEMSIGGGGLGAIKYPDRVHLRCGQAYHAMKEANRAKD